LGKYAVKTTTSTALEIVSATWWHQGRYRPSWTRRATDSNRTSPVLARDPEPMLQDGQLAHDRDRGALLGTLATLSD
jgi:hypothetical protein